MNGAQSQNAVTETGEAQGGGEYSKDGSGSPMHAYRCQDFRNGLAAVIILQQMCPLPRLSSNSGLQLKYNIPYI